MPLDMSDSSLCSVSPLHLLYLGNMGVRASASFSIVKDGVLWDLVACHNDTPRSLTYGIRAACRSLVASLARQIKVKEEAEGYRQRIRLRSFEDDLVTLLSREGSLDEALSRHLDEIGRMMGGDGVVVLRGRELVMSGVCPGKSDIRDLAAWLLARTIEPIFSTDDLSKLHPPAAGFQHLGSGVLAVTLSADEPWLLLWFRVEQVETANWAGNPHKEHSGTPQKPLTPRASFAAWREIVRGHARGWTLPEVDAATRLRGALLEVQQNRCVRELTRRLYRGDQIEVVNAAHYIEELCADTFSFMGHDWTKHLSLDLSPVLVSTDRAVTLGLVLTELLINSNKYAYDGAAGPVEITLREDRTHLHLIVADKGVGKASSRKGFGSRIMEGLVAQLGGKLTNGDNHPGLCTEIIVPVETPKRPA